MHFEDYFLENLRFVNFIQYLNQLLDKFNITFNLCSPKKKKLLDSEIQLNIAYYVLFSMNLNCKCKNLPVINPSTFSCIILLKAFDQCVRTNWSVVFFI